MTQIALVALPPDQPTAYQPNGATRLYDGQVPHLSQIRTVGQLDSARWRLSTATLAAFLAFQTAWEAMGGEPFRLTDAWRDQGVQGRLHAGYLAWVQAGRPDHSSTRWRADMRTAYAAAAGESNHGWGGAFDVDVGALVLPDLARGSAAVLAKFWDLGARYGFSPIVHDADPRLSECWHFDHLGPLTGVRALYEGNGYTPGYSHAARVGCALAGTFPPGFVPDIDLAYAQACLAIAGIFPGTVDGVWGPKSRAAFAAAGLKSPGKVSSTAILAAIHEAGIGQKELSAA